MLKNRFFLSCCFVIAFTLLALISFPHATVHAASLSPSSGHALSLVKEKAVPFTTIHRVSDSLCASRTDFFKLWNDSTSAGGVCFASDGGLNVDIFDVGQITTGNNAGFVIDHDGQKFKLCQNQTFDHFIAHVIFVEITGRTC